MKPCPNTLPLLPFHAPKVTVSFRAPVTLPCTSVALFLPLPLSWLGLFCRKWNRWKQNALKCLLRLNWYSRLLLAFSSWIKGLLGQFFLVTKYFLFWGFQRFELTIHLARKALITATRSFVRGGLANLASQRRFFPNPESCQEASGASRQGKLPTLVKEAWQYVVPFPIGVLETKDKHTDRERKTHTHTEHAF